MFPPGRDTITVPRCVVLAVCVPCLVWLFGFERALQGRRGKSDDHSSSGPVRVFSSDCLGLHRHHLLSATSTDILRQMNCVQPIPTDALEAVP